MGFDISTLLKRTGRKTLDDRVTTLAAQTAYYSFFSLFPLLLFLAPLMTLLVDQGAMMQFVTGRLSAVLPPEALEPVTKVLTDGVFVDDAPGLMSIGAVLAAWSGSNIFRALTVALNLAYEVEEFRPWWRQQLVRLGMLAGGGTVMIVATVVLLAGDTIARAVGAAVGLGTQTVALWNFIQFPVAFAFVVLLAFLIYWLLPNVRQRKRHVLVAAIITSVLWLMATLLFRFYVQHFPPNPAYGVIGGIMILLTWMYVTMFVVLAVGELASEMHKGTGAVNGREGTTYFGRIVSGERPGQTSRTSAA
ncbi:MAG: YihY/virulence factor BrkB family protein [Gemmatimonadaceae bacterium]